MNGMLVSVLSPMLQSSLVGTMSEIYLEHFELAVRELKDNNEAFEIVERARGRGMADALQDHQQLRSEVVSDSNPAEIQITNLQRRLRQQQTSAERAQLLDELDEAETKLAGAEYEHDQFRKLVPSRPVSLNDLEHSLDADEVVLEYILSDPYSYCLVITRDGEMVRTLASRTRIDKLIGKYLTGVTAKRPTDAAARQLYTWLMADCLTGMNERRLIIIPDGKLNDIPFASLMDPRGRYVAESHVVSVAPSSTVLYMLRHEVHPEAKYAFLGVAYSKGARAAKSGESVTGKLADVVRGVFDLNNPNIDPLPYANEEVKAAASNIGHGSVVLLGRNATEEKLKSEPLGDFEILHFAVHGVVNTHEPDRSALLFGDGPHSKEDGLWQAREIRALSLKADLVTLSACDTGIGKIEGEERVDSLVGAFLMAGAKNVVASLWPASDRYTATLMEKFYAHLAQGMDDAAALNRAELDILQQYGHQTAPYYWAAFETIGEGKGNFTFPNGALNAALKN